MNVMNRVFISIFAVLWCALLGGLLYLLWDVARTVDVTGSAFSFGFSWQTETESERALASLVVGAMMLPAVGLLFMEMLVWGGARSTDPRARERERALEARVEALQRRLDAEGTRTSTDAPQPVESRPERRRWKLFPSRQ